MGGDHAPRAIIEGALQACQTGKHPAELILIGHEARLRETLGRTREISPIRIFHAPDTIGMEEAGPIAIRKKREASLSVAMCFLADNEVDAVISAGNSGAVVATAKHFVGLVPGLRRPALAVPIPTPHGEVILADAGAHAEATAIQLAQSAVLAHAYLKVTKGLSQPRVGLLNIGQEPLKGTQVIQRAFTLLGRTRLHFMGNVEPRDIFTNQTDALICDGFAGNIFLKLFEALAENLFGFWKANIEAHRLDLGQEMVEDFNRLQRNYYYQRVGGAPLLGVRKTVVVAHGCSDASAISNAIRLACHLVETKVFEGVAAELERDSMLSDLKHYYAHRMLDRWKSTLGFTSKKT